MVIAATGVAEDYTASFSTALDAPEPASQTPMAKVEDPGEEYFPRQFALGMPRDADPKKAATSASIFQPVNGAQP